MDMNGIRIIWAGLWRLPLVLLLLVPCNFYFWLKNNEWNRTVKFINKIVERVRTIRGSDLITSLVILLLGFLALLVISPFVGIESLANGSIIESYLDFFRKIGTFSQNVLESADSSIGTNGDSFGVLNPIIAISAALLTFLAFWIQYNANQEMLKNGAKLQLERQFYEMLKIHQDNVKNLHFESRTLLPLKGKPCVFSVHGQDCMKALLDEFNWIYEVMNNKCRFSDVFEKAYHVFFSGMDAAAENGKISEKLYGYLKEHIENATYNMGPKFLALKNTLCQGRIEQLNSYYRHLFLIVKTVVGANDKIFSYEEKRQFLRILRAQLTSAEQVLLFYNWRSGCGGKWEGDNHYFTDYRMIHNINPKDCVAFSKEEIVAAVMEKNHKLKCETGKSLKEDSLFELI